MTHTLDKIEFMEGSVDLLRIYMCAKYMEENNLKKNIPRLDSIDKLFTELTTEVDELHLALLGNHSDDTILRELADVANYCALIAGALMRRSE